MSFHKSLKVKGIRLDIYTLSYLKQIAAVHYAWLKSTHKGMILIPLIFSVKKRLESFVDTIFREWGESEEGRKKGFYR